MQKTHKVSNLVVGDVVFLTTGDPIPADGLFVDGHSMKVGGFRVHIDVNLTQNSFLLSGLTMTNGYGRMVVKCMGMNKQISYSIYYTMQKFTMQDRLENLTTG